MMTEFSSRLALGSVNFGLDYGVTNSAGKLSQLELKKILYAAEEAGIKIVDTAQAYGDSEAQIGALCRDERFKMVTKIGVDLEKGCLENSVSNLVEQSCNRLNQSRLYAVLLHRPEVLLGDEGSVIVRELLTLKEKGLISKIGISIYSPEILEDLTKRVDLDIVQVPFNVFDQQICSTGWRDKLKNKGTEIHTRSVFLQGLLLMEQSNLPKFFKSNWPELFNSWYEFLKMTGSDAVQVALQFALKQDWIDNIVVGVDSAAQLRSLLEIERSEISQELPDLRSEDTNLINPSNWIFE